MFKLKMKSIILALVLTALPSCATDLSQASKEEITYERGAVFFAKIHDYSIPFFQAKLNGTRAIVAYDTGANGLLVFRDVIDTVPFTGPNAPKAEPPLRNIEPVKIEIEGQDGSFNWDPAVDMPWSDFGLDSVITTPFFSGVIPHLYYENGYFAFERNASENWFALFETPHDPGFKAPVSIDVELQPNGVSVATFKIKLPGTQSSVPVRLLLDTGSGRNLILSSQLFQPASLPDKSAQISATVKGSIKGKVISGVELYIADHAIELNNVAILDAENFEDKAYADYDGILGSRFLNRFHHVIDISAGSLILELDGADLESNAPHINSPSVQPYHTWRAAIITHPGLWDRLYGVQKADLIDSVDAEPITPERYAHLLELAWDKNSPHTVCIIRNHGMKERQTRFCFDTVPIKGED